MPGHHMTVTRHEGGPPPSTESASTVTRRQGIAGPYLRYINILPDSGVWLGSILVLLSCPQPEGGDVTQLPAGTQAPAVSLSLGGEPAASPAPDLLDWVESWQFWRFDLEFPLGPQEQCFTYSVSHAHGTTAEFTVHLPAAQRPMHWAYYSCNGMSADVKPDAPERQDVTYLWRDMLALHGAYPLHVVFGGGDQVYSDRVWACPALQAWARLSTRSKKVAAPWAEDMGMQATEFYCRNYIDHFSTSDVALAFASIPQLMIWDDHDIWDGYGSYDSDMQGCTVFKNLFVIAERFFLLFQKHTTVQHLAKHKEFLHCKREYHSVHYMGPTVALFLIDMRSKRTKKQCFALEDQCMVRDVSLTLPNTIEHLVIASGVPLIWPAVPYSEKLVRLIGLVARNSTMFQRLGRKIGLLDRFDQPEILDDMRDGWMADVHRDGRKRFIDMLQKLCSAKKFRVTVLSGDAHVAGIGRIYSWPKISPLCHDPLFIPQVTSSAIVNAPPPQPVVRMLTRTNFSRRFGRHMHEKMVRAFFPTHPSVDKLLARRNWCDITLVAPPYTWPMNPDDNDANGLRFVIRAEDPKNRVGHAEEMYEVCVPRYIPDPKKGVPQDAAGKQLLADAYRAVHAMECGPPAMFYEPRAEAVKKEAQVPSAHT